MPQRAVPDVELLVRRSHQLGLTTCEGSASVKSPACADGPALLQISAAGADLAVLTRDAIAQLELDLLVRLLDASDDAPVDRAVSRSRHDGPAPARDLALHALLPHAHVDVLRPDAVVALALAAEGADLVARCFSGTLGWVPAAAGALQVARDVRAAALADPALRGVVVAGLGLVTWGDTSEDCLAATLDAVRTAEQFVAGIGRLQPLGAVLAERQALPPAEREQAVAALFPVLRGLASGSQRQVGHLADSDEVLDLLSRAEADRLVQLACAGDTPLLPAGLAGVVVDRTATDEEITEQLAVARPELAPSAFLVPGVGLFAFASDKAGAVAAAGLWTRALTLLRTVESIGAYGPATAPQELQAPWAQPASAVAPVLAGRIALVTGGGSGIGRAVSTLLAEHGACVVVADLDLAAAEKTVSELPSAAAGLAVEADVCDEAAVRAAVAATVRAFGGLDLLVNNAGLSISKPLQETTSADWDLQHDVMARGSFLVAQAAARVMQVQRLDSDIVYVASKNAAFAGPNNLAYGAAKANQAHQVRLLAAELGPFGVRVNGVSPDGVVQGSGIFANGWGKERAKVYGVPVDELGAFYAQRTLLKREVLPSHVADAVLALTSGLLSRTTGAILPVDGGVTGAFLR
jgi:NAD(P)-dependent dehydrogenase (short-subunit alcohol dehydrogenase family)/rhamnose utilization protein RhaD (predicted bifunctional aldolase and dehydrogenase)